jgi:Ca2+/H+ antiporter, TMEM165/GDT1 family
MRKKNLFWLIPVGILGIVVFSAIGGGVVMLLWNWLAPELFGLKPITFWQAFGLLALCRILFGGFGGGGGRRCHSGKRAGEKIRARVRERIDERLDEMTPEERERLRERLRDHSRSTSPLDPTAGA